MVTQMRMRLRNNDAESFDASRRPGDGGPVRILRMILLPITYIVNELVFNGWEPWSSGYGRRLMFKRS